MWRRKRTLYSLTPFRFYPVIQNVCQFVNFAYILPRFLFFFARQRRGRLLFIDIVRETRVWWRMGDSFPPQQCNLMPGGPSVHMRTIAIGFWPWLCQIMVPTKICFHFCAEYSAICHGFGSYPWWLFDILQLIIAEHAQKFSAHILISDFAHARSL